MQRSIVFLIVLPLLLAAGCASGPSGGGGPATTTERQDPNQLRADEISRFGSAFQAIQALRSQWLRVRSAGSFNTRGQVQVYRDGTRLGGPEVLDRMSTADIGFIQYYDGRAASQRWGLGHENGAIYVASRNQ